MRSNNSPLVSGSAVSYLDLPKKKQMILLCLARLVDPMSQSSINSYLFFQVQYLLPSASVAQIATYTGVVYAARTMAKVCTGVLWGRMADSRWGGRKLVLFIGLSSSCLACIGYGLSTTFTSVVLWQTFAGATSSNVGITRCVVAEINTDRRLRARALLLLATFGNVGSFIGPLIGGWLVSPPQEGYHKKYPFALPNIVVAVIYGITAIGVALLLEETLERSPTDALTFRALWQKIRNLSWLSGKKAHGYSALRQEESSPLTAEEVNDASELTKPIPKELLFTEIWTAQVVCTLVAQFLISAHITSFQILWISFLSTPVDHLKDYHRSILSFGGGIGLKPASIGLVMSALNGVGVLLQLTAYPWFNDRWNTIQIWHVALMFFPFTYFFAPFPALVASSGPDSANGTPAAVWITIAGVLALNVIGRTGAIPAMTILINDCVPGPSARATINMAGMTSAQLSKTIFPIGILAIYGWGLQRNIVGLAFWVETGLAVIAIVASRWVRSSPGPSKTVIVNPERNERV